MHISRRQFFKICGVVGLGGSSMAIMGFAPVPVLAAVREFKLLRATEARNACTYCSVSCGILLYSLGDPYRNANDPSSE